MTVSERVKKAVDEFAQDIDRQTWADVTFRLQDGKVVFVEVAAKFKPKPEHYHVCGGQLPNGNRYTDCSCGKRIEAETLALLEIRFQKHVEDSK